MSSLNGLKNIKTLLIISFFSFSLISSLVFYKSFEKVTFISKVKCDAFSNFNESPYNIDEYGIRYFYDFIFSEFMEICRDFQIREITNDVSTVYFFKFDSDSISYLQNLAQLNHFKILLRKKLLELNTNEKNFKNVKNKLRIEGRLNQDSLSSYKKQFENPAFRLFDELERNVMAFTNLVDFKTKHIHYIGHYSNLYSKFFNNNAYIYHFIIFINFMILLFLLILFYKIIRILFPSLPKILNLLVVSNVAVCPLISIYFLTFYKEPLILLSITMIIFNYVYFLTKKINLKRFIVCTFGVVAAFLIIRYVKYEYNAIYMASFLLSALILNLYKKNLVFFSICCLQFIVVISFLSFISPNFNSDITKQKVISAYEDTLYTTKNLYKKTIYSLAKLMIKDTTSINEEEYNKLENQLIKMGALKEKLSPTERDIIIDEIIMLNLENKAANIKNKTADIENKSINIKDILISKIQGKGLIEAQKKKIDKQKEIVKIKPLYSASYYTPEIKTSEIKTFKILECYEYLKNAHCKKINNFSYRLWSIKKATLDENGFFNSTRTVKNENIVNDSFYFSTISVLMQIPISATRGYFMPLLLNSDKLITLLSLFKLVISSLSLYICYFYYKNKSMKSFLIIFGTFIIFLPLVTAIDIVTSNYFTYFRYVYPLNGIMLVITFSFIVNKILELKND